MTSSGLGDLTPSDEAGAPQTDAGDADAGDAAADGSNPIADAAPDGSDGRSDEEDASVSDAAGDATQSQDGGPVSDAGPELDAEVDADASDGPDGALEEGGFADADATPPEDAGPDGDASDANDADAAAPACPLDGRYALRIDAAVSWELKRLFGFVPILRAGEGELTVTVLVDLERDGAFSTGVLRPCDAVIPDFLSTEIAGNELFSLYFAPEVWDAAEMPETPVRIELDCTEPGCDLALDPLRVLVGAAMEDPTAAWPEEAEALAYPDHDGDGLEGVTLSARGPYTQPLGTYSYPRTGVREARASAIMLGIRVVVELQGQLEDCETLSGTAGTFAIDTHVPECTALEGEGGSCTASQASFIDDNLPQWTSESASFRALRVADDASCADVRAAVEAD